MDSYKTKELKVKAIQYNRQNYPEILEYFKGQNHIVFLMERRWDGALEVKVQDSNPVRINVGDYILHKEGDIGDISIMTGNHFDAHYVNQD